MVARIDPPRIDRLRVLEGELTAAATGRGAKNPKRGFFQSSQPDLEGVYRPRSIDEAVVWSNTNMGRGVVDPEDLQRDGCMRWGLCGTEPEPDRGAGP